MVLFSSVSVITSLSRVVMDAFMVYFVLVFSLVEFQ